MTKNQNEMPTDAPAKKTRNPLHVGLAWAKALISVGLLWLLFTAYDVGEAISRLASIDPLWLSAAVLLFFVSTWIVTWRWILILRALGNDLPFVPVFGLVFIGQFFNQTLPSNLGGDAMRIWRLFKHGAVLGRAVGSVMLDRVAALVALSLLVLFGFPLAAELIEDTRILTALGVLVALVLAGLITLLSLDRVIGLVRRILPERLVSSLSSLARDSRAVLLTRRYGPAVMALSVINQLVIVVLMLMLALGLGIAADFLSFLVLVPPVVLATVLPLSFAGWGVREGAMVAMMGTIGVAPADALALSVAFGLILLVGSLPGGIVWFVTDNRKAS
jgi:hypothetical protein